MPDSSPLVRTVEVELPASTILATTSENVRSPFAGTVQAVRYLPLASVTGAASPSSRTLSLVNRGQDGSGSTVVASLALVATVNLVAFDEKTITLSAVAGATTVAEGDVLEFRSAAVGGTGLVEGGGTAIVEIARV
jgi:hypothetical protein